MKHIPNLLQFKNGTVKGRNVKCAQAQDKMYIFPQISDRLVTNCTYFKQTINFLINITARK